MKKRVARDGKTVKAMFMMILDGIERYDLSNAADGLDLESHMGLVKLSAVWQRRNAAQRVARCTAPCLCTVRRDCPRHGCWG